MIALDTNVLLRVLVDDGSRDVARARAFVTARATEGHDFLIDTVVLVEVVWVLESVYGYARAAIATAIEALLGNAAYVLDGRDAVAVALADFRGGKADFSDCLIAIRCAAAGCAEIATFDKAMRALPGVKLIRRSFG